jgi:hypothetical protein
MKITHRFGRIREIAGGAALAMLAEIMFAIVGSLAVAPAAHAQIVPASLTHEAVPDSRIPSSVTLLTLPRIEPRKPVADAHKRLFFVMSAGVYAAAGLDMQETAFFRHRFREYDPLGKPLVGLSTPAYYAAAALFATGVNWLGWKMARSPRCHKIWWVPQVTSISGNVAGYSYTRGHRITN